MADQIKLIGVDAASFSSSEVAPNLTLTLETLKGGKQEGTQLVVIDNGAITIRIIPTRGMGILDVKENDGDIRLGWDSPVKQVVNPAYMNLEARNGLGWLEGFNEYLVRCGIEWFGAPCEDMHHHCGAEAPAQKLTVHGKIANIPAAEVSYTVEGNKLHIDGITYETMMYGPKYKLATRITVEAGKKGFAVTDALENIGGQAEEYGLLYHINHGAPLLEAGSKWLAPLKWVAPRDDDARNAEVDYDTYLGPTTGLPEQVFLGELHAENDSTCVMLQNGTENQGVVIGFKKSQLPCLTVWKAQHNVNDGYVTGLEPGTNYPMPRPEERKAGRVPTIEPGETKHFELTFDLLTNSQDVAASQQKIEQLKAGQDIQMLDEVPAGALEESNV